MNNKLYFKYFLLLLITFNSINVNSFNPRSNQIMNFLVIRNVNTYPYNLKSATVYCRISTNSNLNSLNKTNNTNNTNNTNKNTLFFNKLLFYINNYTYS
jgi:hypothetical protein